MSKLVGVPLTETQLRIVDMVKETLAEALEGRFHSMAIVVCMKEGFSHAMCGKDGPSLNIALDDLKDEILKGLKSGTDERQTRGSSLLKLRQ